MQGDNGKQEITKLLKHTFYDLGQMPFRFSFYFSEIYAFIHGTRSRRVSGGLLYKGGTEYEEGLA